MSQTIELKIEGMSCGHCVRSVAQAIESTPGVQSADVRLEEGAATVTHDGTASIESMIRSIEEEGFKAVPH